MDNNILYGLSALSLGGYFFGQHLNGQLKNQTFGN